MEADNHHPENCPLKDELLQLQQEYSELHKNAQLSATYGAGLLEENQMLKQQIQKSQSIQEVYMFVYCLPTNTSIYCFKIW